MNIKKYAEKLKGVMSEEDILAFESDVKKAIEESTDLRVEATVKDVEEKADEYCEMMIEKKTAEIKEELIKEYDEKLSKLETDIVEKLDVFLESEISSQIKPELFESVARTKVYEPIIEGIVKLFEEKYVALDTDGNTLVKKLEEDVSGLKKQLDEQISKNMESNKLLEKVAVSHLIGDKTKDLTESQVTKVKSFFESKGFDEVEEKIESFIDLIIESDVKKENSITESQSNVSEEKIEVITEAKNESSKFVDEDLVDVNKKQKDYSISVANNLL